MRTSPTQSTTWKSCRITPTGTNIETRSAVWYVVVFSLIPGYFRNLLTLRHSSMRKMRMTKTWTIHVARRTRTMAMTMARTKKQRKYTGTNRNQYLVAWSVEQDDSVGYIRGRWAEGALAAVQLSTI